MEVVLLNYFMIPILMFVIIAIHEISHYYAAKIFGIKKIRLSIGAWIPIIKILKNSTEIIINIIPIVGNTKFDHIEYNKLKLWKKCFIELSGYAISFITLIIPLRLFPNLLNQYIGSMRQIYYFVTTGDINELYSIQSVFSNHSGVSPYLNPPTALIIFIILQTLNLLLNTLPFPSYDVGRFIRCIASYITFKISAILKTK